MLGSVGIFVVVLTLLCIAFCIYIAKKRGANPVFWAVMAAVFGPFAIPFVFRAKQISTDKSDGE